MHYCHCVCDCEDKTEKDIRACHLLSGAISDCGCMFIEHHRVASTHHGMNFTRIHGIWSNMKNRCNNISSTEYKNYGGRGIIYDERWEEFENFYEDMGKSYEEHVTEFGEKDTTIDRINVDGNYCKDNCKWSSIDEQANNKTTSHYITVDGKTKTAMQWSKISKVPFRTILSRLKRNWSTKDAIFTKAKRLTSYTYKDETHTVSEWARLYNMHRNTLDNRLTYKKWTIEKALTTPIKGSSN